MIDSKKKGEGERIKLYRIYLNASRNNRSLGYYRSVEHYRRENKQLPFSSRTLSRSLKDWIYEDTMNQQELPTAEERGELK